MATINRYNLHNTGLFAAMERYPKTGAARYFINQYNIHTEWQEEEPTSIKIHRVWQNYGGPEEGGWYYQAGEGEATHFIFSKKSCIKRCIELVKLYSLDTQPSISTSQGLTAYELTIGSGYAESFPEERPYYC